MAKFLLYLWIGVSAYFQVSEVQAQRALEVTGSVGYTAVDLELLVDKDEIDGTTLNNWEQLSSGASIQYFFLPLNENLMLGGEFMYQYLYWYQVRVPFGSQPITREYDVDVYRLTPVFRFGGDKSFKIDIGPTINFMDDVNVGVMAAAGYYLPLTGNLTLPVKIRVDVMNYIVLTAPVSLNLGLNWKFSE